MPTLLLLFCVGFIITCPRMSDRAVRAFCSAAAHENFWRANTRRRGDLIEANSPLRRPLPRGPTRRPAQEPPSASSSSGRAHVLLTVLLCGSQGLPDHKCLGLGLCVAACVCPLRAQQCTIPVLRRREEWTKARSCYKPMGQPAGSLPQSLGRPPTQPHLGHLPASRQRPTLHCRGRCWSSQTRLQLLGPHAHSRAPAPAQFHAVCYEELP